MNTMSREKPQPGGKPQKAPKAWVPARPESRGAAPALLSEVLVGAETYLAERSGAAIPRAEWTSIVGPRIAARTRVGKLRQGVLTVKVASSAWSQELSFLKLQLVAKLRRAGHEVSDLRFFVDHIADDAKTSKPQRRISQNRQQNGQPLPPDLVKRLERVDDPNLRAAIAEAARSSLGRK